MVKLEVLERFARDSSRRKEWRAEVGMASTEDGGASVGDEGRLRASAADIYERVKREAGEGAAGLPNPDFYVTRQYTHDEVLPWDFIDHHIHKWFLLSERKKAHYEHQTKPCDVTRCTVCGAC